MKIVDVEIKGISPLLMHSCSGMEDKEFTEGLKRMSKEDYAEKVAYRMNTGNLMIPSRCLKACLINASSWYKFGRRSAKQVIAGCVQVRPLELDLGVKDFEIDVRPVVIQGSGRILRARPMLRDWKVKFELHYNESVISDEDTLKTILEDAGLRIGLLDNRPQKYGENGCFIVTKFKVRKK